MLVVLMNDMLIDLPSPSSISYLWGFGSLLGVFLGAQIVTGIFLALHFSADVSISFFSVVHICRDVNNGWLLRVLHSNGASVFFLLLYFHIGRGYYYGSYRFMEVWLSGVSLFLLAMGTAFLGYVLPWGQMSFWAATVITNLLSAVPYLGVLFVEWVWGGFAVSNPTLTRFFTFHFLFPFVLIFFVFLHLMFLHKTGSSSALGCSNNLDSIVFYPYFVYKDLVGFLVGVLILMILCFEVPYYFMDVENFIPANPLVTPIHIQPEWYFLFAYSILRSISSSVGGVIALLLSVLLLYLFPFVYKHSFRSSSLYFFMKGVFWVVVVNWLLLTWVGTCVVEFPYTVLGSIFSSLYFGLFIFSWLLYSVVDLSFDWF